MRNANLSKQEATIRALIKSTRSATGGDLELQSHWAKYLCVLVAGYVENAAQVLYTTYVLKIAPAPVANYASSRLKQIQNPKPARLIEIATGFNKDWGVSLKTFLDLEGRKEAVNAVMDNRHLIAHGKNSDITVHRISKYFDRIVEVAEFIENQLI